MTNYNVENKDLQGEHPITQEHIQNNTSVREMLGNRGIKDNQDFATLCQFCNAAEQNQLSDRNKSALSSHQALEYLVKAICWR